MEVYAAGYFWRIAEVLREQFELSAWLIGDPNFHNVLTDYLLAHPSRHPDIRQSGADLPEALAASTWAQHVPSILDIAALEWGLVQALDAADEPVLHEADLAAIPLAQWPDLRLGVTRTLTLRSCELPFATLRERMLAGEPAHGAREPGPLTWTAVWRRPNLEVWHRPVETHEAGALELVAAGGSFARLCDHAAAGTSVRIQEATSADAARTAASWLRQWLSEGLLTTLRVEPT